MSLLRYASLLTRAAWLAVVAVGFFSFLGLLALRFHRRGATRFWATPAALALCLLPAAVAASFSGFVLGGAFSGIALTGTAGVAAIAAGTAEALTPLLVGFAVMAALTGCAFLAMAVGSSRSTAPESSGRAAWALLATALAAVLLLGGVAAMILWLAATVNRAHGLAPSVGTWLQAALAAACVLAVLTPGVAVAATLLAPRGPSGIGMKRASLATFPLCGLLALAGVGVTWSSTAQLLQVALTGVRKGELPEPAPVALDAEPPPLAPPPRAPPASVERIPRRDLDRASSDGAALRIGGQIREPRKIKHVNPVYPDVALQARVQGVVILEATIGRQGRVTAVRVLRGIPLLDQAAVDAVRQWVYEPTRVNGVAVSVIMTVTVNYKLGPG